MVNQSIIVGLVIGGGVAVIGALLGHLLRLREMRDHWDKEKQRMEALWAEEERRRKSARRREVYERELRIVGDLADAVIGARAALARPASLLGMSGQDARARLIGDVVMMAPMAHVVTTSLGDQGLRERYEELFASFIEWWGTIDWETGEVVEGKKEECERLARQMNEAAAEIRRRITEIVVEV